jgi:hypothetical protein
MEMHESGNYMYTDDLCKILVNKNKEIAGEQAANARQERIIGGLKDQIELLVNEREMLREGCFQSDKKLSVLREHVARVNNQLDATMGDLGLVSRLLKDSSDMTLRLVRERDDLKRTIDDLLQFERRTQIETFKNDLDLDTLATDMSNLIGALKADGYEYEDIKRMMRPNIEG